jgi:hypothetical protein
MPVWLVVVAALILLAFAGGIYYSMRVGGMSRRFDDEVEVERAQSRSNSNVFWGG